MFEVERYLTPTVKTNSTKETKISDCPKLRSLLSLTQGNVIKMKIVKQQSSSKEQSNTEKATMSFSLVIIQLVSLAYPSIIPFSFSVSSVYILFSVILTPQTV